MSFKLTVLGAGSAIPSIDSHPTSQLLSHHNSLYLIDCGEGTQIRLREQKIKIQRIQRIFISHLHGDHYLGLFGLLQTQHLLGRKSPIYVYGPDQLQELMQLHSKVSNSILQFPVIFKPTDSKKIETLYKDDKIEIIAFPLKHRIPTTGFLFKEMPKPLKINKEAISKYNIGIEEIKNIKIGKTIQRNGREIPLEKLTLPAEPLKSYAYCSDTAYNTSIAEVIKNTDVVYHEATFMDKDSDKAIKTFHSTAKQAATIALQANAKKLIIGHFSNRYLDCREDLLAEAQSVFKNTIIAEEGSTIEF